VGANKRHRRVLYLDFPTERPPLQTTRLRATKAAPEAHNGHSAQEHDKRCGPSSSPDRAVPQPLLQSACHAQRSAALAFAWRNVHFLAGVSSSPRCGYVWCAAGNRCPTASSTAASRRDFRLIDGVRIAPPVMARHRRQAELRPPHNGKGHARLRR